MNAIARRSASTVRRAAHETPRRAASVSGWRSSSHAVPPRHRAASTPNRPRHGMICSSSAPMDGATTGTTMKMPMMTDITRAIAAPA